MIPNPTGYNKNNISGNMQHFHGIHALRNALSSNLTFHEGLRVGLWVFVV